MAQNLPQTDNHSPLTTRLTSQSQDSFDYRDYTLQITITHRPVFQSHVFTALLRDVFQQRTFLCSRAQVFAGWRPSHTNLLGTGLTVLLLSRDLTTVAERCLLRHRLATGDCMRRQVQIFLAYFPYCEKKINKRTLMESPCSASVYLPLSLLGNDSVNTFP
jgi:hypothetical protein